MLWKWYLPPLWSCKLQTVRPCFFFFWGKKDFKMCYKYKQQEKNRAACLKINQIFSALCCSWSCLKSVSCTLKDTVKRFDTKHRVRPLWFMMLGTIYKISNQGPKQTQRLMAEHTVDSPCCSVIDSGRALSLCHFSSFIPYHWILRERTQHAALFCDEWPTSAAQCGGKLTQSLRLICHRRLFLWSQQTPPALWFCPIKQMQPLMQNNVFSSCSCALVLRHWGVYPWLCCCSSQISLMITLISLRTWREACNEAVNDNAVLMYDQEGAQ